MDRNASEVKGKLAWKVHAVLGVPGGVVAGVHDTVTALGLVFLVLGLDHHGLVVSKQHQVSPFFDHGCSLFLQFQLPAVVGAQIVRLFKLPHLGVGGHDDVHTPVDDLLQQVQQAAKLLHQDHVAFAIAGGLDAGPLVDSHDVLHAQLLCPVSGVDNQGGAQVGVLAHMLHLLHQHGPAVRGWQPAHIQLLGAALGVNKQGVGKFAGKG